MNLLHFSPCKASMFVCQVTFLSICLGAWCDVEAAGAPSLTWDQPTVELKAPLDAVPGTKLEARFNFKNTADHAIEIVTVQSDCGCTVPELNPRRYAPGQTGVVTARYPVGDKVGKSEKHIAICTSDAPDKPTILTAIVDVPKFLDFKPSALVWKPGEASASKIVEISSVDGIAIKGLAVSTSQMLFAPTLHMVKEGTQYVLEVKPTRTDLACTAQLSLSGEFEVAANKESEKPVTVSKVILLHADIKAVK